MRADNMNPEVTKHTFDILGIGECLLELALTENAERAMTYTVSGDVYNTLVAASRLGGQVSLISQVNPDALGQIIIGDMQHNQIDTAWLAWEKNAPNGLYFNFPASGPDHTFIYYRQASAASLLSPSHVTLQRLKSAKVLYVTGITQAISTSARKAVLKACQLAKKHNITVAYDPNYRAKLWKKPETAWEAFMEVLPFVDVLMPSARDLTVLLPHQDLDQWLNYFQLKDIPIVLIKQGQVGVTLGLGSQQAHISAFPTQNIVDTVGAGDVFNGAFLYTLLQQRSLLDCAKVGAYVAAQSLQAKGAIQNLPSAQQMSKHLHSAAI